MTEVGQSARGYVKAGLVLVPIPAGQKGPRKKGWNRREACVSCPDQASELSGNIGLAHAFSGTCALDIDDLDKARAWFSAKGLDLDALLSAPDKVAISSGRENRAKLLYRLPPGVDPLVTKQMSGHGFELRCASASGLTVQDVLPPSIHPETSKPYTWALGEEAHLSKPPQLPRELEAIWRELLGSSNTPAPSSSAALGSVEEARALLAKLDPDLDYGDWIKAGMALHHESGGAPWGLDLWDEWSATGAKYKGRQDLSKRWKGFGKMQGRPVTLAWLKSQANALTAGDFQDLTASRSSNGERFPVAHWAEVSATDSSSAWWIKGILARGELAVVYGESGSGKSFIAMDMCLAIATGRDWNGHRVQQGRVVYVCAEGQSGFRKRIRAYQSHLGVDLSQYPLFAVTDPPNLLAEDHLALAQSIQASGGADLIVIDTFAQTTPGANENSSEDMGKALAHCRKLAAVTGATVVLVHHAGKDHTKGARGWSGLKAAADTEIEISRGGANRRLKVTKQKDGADQVEVAFNLKEIDLGQDVDGDPVSSCVVEFIDPSSRKPTTPHLVGHLQRCVWETIETALHFGELPVTLSTLISLVQSRRVESRPDSIKRAVSRWVEEGWLARNGDEISLGPRARGQGSTSSTSAPHAGLV